MARLLKRLFGVLALLLGGTLLVWFLYNQVSPSPEFQRSYISIFQVAVPVLMLWVGWRWLTGKPVAAARPYPHFVFAKILDPIGAIERGSKYADPLQDSLEEQGFGEVSGGGTELTEEGQIAWVGLDLELADLEGALEFARKRLLDLGAPPGSVLEYEVEGEEVVLSVGDP